MFEMSYEDYINDKIDDEWMEEVFTWAKEMGIDPEDYDREDREDLEKMYREHLEEQIGYSTHFNNPWRYK